MKQKGALLFFNFICALLMAAAPVFVHAQSSDVNSGLNELGTKIGANTSTGFFNSRDSVVLLIGKIINIMLFISGAVAVLFVVIGGFMYLTSAGNEEQAGKGRKTIEYALIGLVIMILAYVVVSVVVNLVQSNI